MRSLEEKKEGFQLWIFTISDDLEELIIDFNKKGINLDYTIDSLDTIENWILQNFQSVEILIADENKFLLDKLSKYVGEIFIKNTGGGWHLELENKKDVYFNIPTVISENISSPIAPLTMLTACISRNKGNYISTVLKNQINKMQEQ